MRTNLRSAALGVLAPAALIALLAAGNHPRSLLQTAPAAQDFTLGVITTRVSLPGNLYDKYMSQLDPAKGNLQAQAQGIMSKMSAAEQQQAQAQAQQNPGLTMMAAWLPRKATIYVRGQEARATTDGLTYHLENYFNSAQKSGLCLVKSQASSSQLAFTYTNAGVKQEWQTISATDADYLIQPTTETALIAGYPCLKTRYTRKPGAASLAQPGPGTAAGMAVEAVGLDVWTSSKMPVSLNFAHPIYVKEKHGIMKIVVYLDKAHKQQMLYEFTSVQSKPVAPQDLRIATTGAVLDYDKDGPSIGLRLLGIMMGAPQTAASPDDK